RPWHSAASTGRVDRHFAASRRSENGSAAVRAAEPSGSPRARLGPISALSATCSWTATPPTRACGLEDVPCTHGAALGCAGLGDHGGCVMHLGEERLRRRTRRLPVPPGSELRGRLPGVVATRGAALPPSRPGAFP